MSVFLLCYIYITLSLCKARKKWKTISSPFLFSSISSIDIFFLLGLPFEWAQKDLGNHGAGEKPQASTFFLLLLLLSRQSWFSYIGGRREGARKSNGWLVGWVIHNFHPRTKHSHNHVIRWEEGGTLGQEEKNQVVGTFSKWPLTQCTGYFSFLSLYLYTDTLSDWWGMEWTLLSRRGARRIWEIRGVFPRPEKKILMQVFRMGIGWQCCWARLFLNIKVFVACSLLAKVGSVLNVSNWTHFPWKCHILTLFEASNGVSRQVFFFLRNCRINNLLQ